MKPMTMRQFYIHFAAALGVARRKGLINVEKTRRVLPPHYGGMPWVVLKGCRVGVCPISVAAQFSPFLKHLFLPGEDLGSSIAPRLARRMGLRKRDATRIIKAADYRHKHPTVRKRLYRIIDDTIPNA